MSSTLGIDKVYQRDQEAKASSLTLGFVNHSRFGKRGMPSTDEGARVVTGTQSGNQGDQGDEGMTGT